MLRVGFSDDAEADLASIGAFSRERFGAARTRLYVRGLRAACRLLGDFPHMAPVHRGIRPEIRVLVHRSHRIFYRIEGETVLIVRILHHARATPTAL